MDKMRFLYTHKHKYILMHLHTLGYYSAIKRNEVVSHGNSENLKNSMPSKISQTKKQILHDFIYMKCLE